jgi:hypothetical protein
MIYRVKGISRERLLPIAKQLLNKGVELKNLKIVAPWPKLQTLISPTEIVISNSTGDLTS